MPANASEPRSRDPSPHRAIETGEPASVWPRPLTAFIGRRDDVAAVGRLCLQDGVRLVTITGPGGMGKTRLAIEVAEHVGDSFDDGAVFVSLASIRDPDLTLLTIAQSLGVPNVSGQSLDQRLRSFLHDKRLLLVLDNLEHLLQAGPDLASLLGRLPRLTILCTSRTRLGLSGEHVYPLASLGADDAVRLFTQHATARDARFDLTTDDHPTVTAICDRLDRLPLAIELAAARVAALPLDALLNRLDNRLPLLTGGPRDAPERQRTMRDTIAWSYGLLADEEQVAFRRLAIFIGGFTLDAATEVAGDGADALDLVESLVGSSLVILTRSEYGALRYMVLETIREFGLDQLQDHGEVAAVSQAHTDYLIALAEGAIPHYDGPNLRIFTVQVTTEFDNIRAALTWCLGVSDAERAVRLAGAIWRNWWAPLSPGGPAWNEGVAEGNVWIERALALARGQGLPVHHLAEALMGAGMFALLQGDLERANASGRELLERSTAEGYGYGAFWANHVLANSARVNQAPARSIAHFEAALALAPTIRNPENHAAMALGHLGEMATDQGDLTRAERWLADADANVRMCRNPHVGADIFYLLGRLYRHQGRYVQAAGMLAESLEALSRAGAAGRTRVPLVELSRVGMDCARPVAAIHFLAAATKLPGVYWPDGELDGEIEPLRAALPEPGFSLEWAVGERLTWDEVMALAQSLYDGSREPAEPD